jgi:hypothetical protein
VFVAVKLIIMRSGGVVVFYSFAVFTTHTFDLQRPLKALKRYLFTKSPKLVLLLAVPSEN